MSSFEIRFEFFQDLSEEDIAVAVQAMLRRIGTGKLRVRTEKGLKDFGFETKVTQMNEDPYE